MKRLTAENQKIVSGRAKKFDGAPTDLPDEELCKSVRRAVKSVAVPADLELKVRNLLGKQLSSNFDCEKRNSD